MVPEGWIFKVFHKVHRVENLQNPSQADHWCFLQTRCGSLCFFHLFKSHLFNKFAYIKNMTASYWPSLYFFLGLMWFVFWGQQSMCIDCQKDKISIGSPQVSNPSPQRGRPVSFPYSMSADGFLFWKYHFKICLGVILAGYGSTHRSICWRYVCITVWWFLPLANSAHLRFGLLLRF